MNILSPGTYLAIAGDVFGCHSWVRRVLLPFVVTGGQGSHCLLQHTGQPHKQRITHLPALAGPRSRNPGLRNGGKSDLG